MKYGQWFKSCLNKMSCSRGASKLLRKSKVELGDMPTQANEIIRFVNSKTSEELEELKIQERT